MKSDGLPTVATPPAGPEPLMLRLRRSPGIWEGRQVMRVQAWGAAVVVLAAAGSAPAEAPKPIKNVVIYREKDRTAGWPANNGCWSWGDEIVVGFMHHYYKEN